MRERTNDRVRDGASLAQPAVDGPSPVQVDRLGQGDAELLRVLVDHSSSLLALIGPHDGRVLSISAAFTRHLGYDPATTLGTRFWGWLAPEDRRRVVSAVIAIEPDESITLDANVLHSDGSCRLAEFTVTNMVNNRVVGAVLVSGQIARSLGAARERADYLSNHDGPTGLLNRSGFFHEMGRLAERAELTGERLGVVLFDIDRMAHVNELLGEAAGDLVLATTARRLEAAVRGGDVVARHGGDEFVVATAISAPDGLLTMQERLKSALGRPITIDGQEIRVSFTSQATSGPASSDVEQLLSEVAARLSRSKRSSEVTTTAPAASALAERRRLIEELQSALDDGQVQPWFQPIVDATETVVGFESLLRWVHPARGALVPPTFLPLVSLAGLEARIDDLVLERSLAFLHTVDEQCGSHSSIVVHVNVTPRQLMTDGLAQQVTNACRRIGADPRRLCVEITEADVLQIGPIALENLARLRQAGIGVAIDDFGTGYSSLAHLMELPIDMLKIDRRFVNGLGLDPMATSLTTAILGLVSSVRLGCVAEGVETREQFEFLVTHGCPQMQGWLWAPALRPEQAIEFGLDSLSRAPRH